jgi:hypothetical protein
MKHDIGMREELELQLVEVLPDDSLTRLEQARKQLVKLGVEEQIRKCDKILEKIRRRTGK